MTVLVTGANGMLATHTIKELVKKNYKVRALLRTRSKYQLEPHPAVNLFTGDILDKKAVDEAVSGCDFLVHVAAVTAPNLPRYESYQKVNVTGTANLMAAAQKHGLKRVVYVSSANTIGHGDREHPGREGEGMKPPFTGSWYARSKKEAEDIVRSYADNMHVVVVNPSFMIGSYDAAPGSGRIVLMGFNKRIAFYPPGGKNFVNTSDVATGIVAALEKGRNGQNYLLTGENLSYRQFFRKMAGLANRNTVLIKIPAAALLGFGYLAKIPAKMRIPTSFSLPNMKVLCVKNYYSNKRAKKELNLEFRPIEDGIKEAVDFFTEKGML